MRTPAPGACIGLDLDNTLVDYGGLFLAAAQRLGLAGPEAPQDKTALRDWLRRRPGGEENWQRVQAAVYGPGLAQARPFAGADAFLARAAAAGYRLAVVSHKTRFAAKGEGEDLHAVARDWLRERGWMGPGAPLAEDRVHFEATRAAKVARIRLLGCAAFVDDLPEVLTHPDFPAGVLRLLFAPGGERPDGYHGLVCADWGGVAGALLENGHA